MVGATILFSLAFLFLFSASAQEGAKGAKLTAFPEPQRSILPVVAYQPECPLEFLKVLQLHNVEGGGFQIFQVRNHGTKPIRSYMIATVTSVGTGSVWGGGSTPLREALLPGHVRPASIDDWNIDVVPVPDEMKAGFDPKGPMKGVVVFIIVRVEFVDGSTYSAEPQYKALRELFEKKPTPSN